jgi:hypothetical protein
MLSIQPRKKWAALFTGAAAAAAGILGLNPGTAPTAHASSHSDAPLIKLDPEANLTDVYTFVGTQYNNPSVPVLNIIVNVHPFCEPGDGVTYDKFADDALYSINVTNPTTGAVLTTYNFQFSAVSGAGGGYKNLNTILSYGRGTTIGPIQTIGDGAQNFTQTYTVTQVTGGNTVTLGTGTVPPPNVGIKTTPLYNSSTTKMAVSGATTESGLDSYTSQAVTTNSGGTVVFAGMRDDSFFADVPGISDLLEARILAGSNGENGDGIDGFKGFNVLTYAIQIPISQLPSPIAFTSPFFGASNGVGVFASVSRPRITLRSSTGAESASSGPYIQVNRLGNPLFNEVLVAIRDKDRYNATLPVNDADPNVGFSSYASSPEIATLLNAVFGTTFVTSGRTDLVAVYIPDVIRVDTTTGPVKLIGPGAKGGGNRFGALGDSTDSVAKSGGGVTSGGWPNGRRLGDDVVDIALTAVASGPGYASLNIIGDNVNANDAAYNEVFPYGATPNSGANNAKDSAHNYLSLEK